MSYGTCKKCGCMDHTPCIHPDHGACWWVDDEHEMCSHCYIQEINDDPATERQNKPKPHRTGGRNTMSNIKISTVKQIREQLELEQIVIFGIDKERTQYVATHGKTRIDAKSAAEWGNNLKKSLSWPQSRCEDKPLERKCENCDFWMRKKIDHSERIPENWPGSCMFEPNLVKRMAEDRACNHFEPKF